jgi:osmotically-inducible protein OsmY
MASRRFGAWQLCWLVFVLITLTAGCKQEDAERMVRVGRKVTAQVEALTADQDGGFHKGWQAICNGWQETTLAGRVAARLRWDKKLADAQIQVSATGKVVELKGTVRDLDQRRRAVDLAEATTGVDKVTDALEVAVP